MNYCLRKTYALCLLGFLLPSCYFFEKHNTNPDPGAFARFYRGPKAGGPIYEQLDELYEIETPHPPAAVRPDPDMFTRRLLLRFHNEGVGVAREIGRVEDFRLLLGGASEDFSKRPGEDYDATSLLAKIKVAEQICTGLIAPNRWAQPGWETILPHSPRKVNANIDALAQKLLGLPSSYIPQETINDLTLIFETTAGSETPALEHYIPVCATLLIDAEGLLL
jgi:hypothetical protein